MWQGSRLGSSTDASAGVLGASFRVCRDSKRDPPDTRPLMGRMDAVGERFVYVRLLPNQRAVMKFLFVDEAFSFETFEPSIN